MKPPEPDSKNLEAMMAISRGDTEFLDRHYQTNCPTIAEFLFTGHPWLPGNASMAKQVWDATTIDQRNGRFFDLAFGAVVNNPNLLLETLKSDDFARRIAPYRDILVEKGTKNIDDMYAWADQKPESVKEAFARKTQYWRNAISMLASLPDPGQKTWPTEQPGLCPGGLRAPDLMDRPEIKSEVDEHLLLIVFVKAKQHGIAADNVPEIFNQAKTIRDQFSQQPCSEGSFHPLVSSLHADIAHELLNQPRKDVHCHNLWDHVTRHSFGDTLGGSLVSEPMPQHLRGSHGENTRMKSCIYVVFEDNAIAMTNEGRSEAVGDRLTHHIDLSNGRPVIAAGTICFSDDMSKVLTIDNQSGHFRPGDQTSFLAREALHRNGFDVSEASVLDFEGQVVRQDPKPSCFGDSLNALRVRGKPDATVSGPRSKQPAAQGA